MSIACYILLVVDLKNVPVAYKWGRFLQHVKPKMANTGAKKRAASKKKAAIKKKAINTTLPAQVTQNATMRLDANDPQLHVALLSHNNDALVVQASLLVDLIKNEQKTMCVLMVKKFAERSLSELVDADQKIEVANCIREFDIHLSLLDMQHQRLVNPSLPTYQHSLPPYIRASGFPGPYV